MNLSHGQQVLEVRIKSSLFFFEDGGLSGSSRLPRKPFPWNDWVKFFDYKLFNLRLKILCCEF